MHPEWRIGEIGMSLWRKRSGLENQLAIAERERYGAAKLSVASSDLEI
jgi:hypothetical protein